MIARAQQFITIAWVTATLAWLAVFLWDGQPALAVVGALAIVSVHAMVLGLEFVLLRFVNRGDPAPPATPRELMRAWWGEVCTATLVFGWRQPYCSMREPDHLPPQARGRRGVVLVHGFVCNRGLWNPWMRHLRAAGVPFVALNLEPVLGSIDAYPALIDAAVKRIEQATGEAPVMVGHSMGGLAVRAWLDRYQADERVHRVVTIASPNQGTWMARFGFVHNAREMRQGGDWITGLAQREPMARRARFVCFYSHCDNIVLPSSTGTLPGADNRHVAGVAHVQLVYQPQVLAAVLEQLGAASGPALAAGAASVQARG